MNSLPDAFPLTEKTARAVVMPGLVTSTNDFVREHLGTLEPFTLVITDQQSKGRGRLGREWIIRQGQGIAASLLMSLPHPVSSWLPLVAGASLVEAARDEGFMSCSVKWPNDVLLDDRKLAGVLCETLPLDMAVVGVGLNVGFAEDDFPSPRATSLYGADAVNWDTVDRVLASWISRMKHWALLDVEDQRRESARLVRGVLGTIGRRVEILEPNGVRWSGKAQDIDDEGHLLVIADSSGKSHVVASADIEHLYQ